MRDGIVVCGQVTAACARFRQRQLNPGRPSPITGQCCRNGTHLLITGRHQERGRAPVTLDADNVVVFFGLPQILFTVRPYRATAVYIRVNQRRQRRDTLQDRIESDPRLPGKGGVGTGARIGDYFVYVGESDVTTIQFPSYVQAGSIQGD